MLCSNGSSTGTSGHGTKSSANSVDSCGRWPRSYRLGASTDDVVQTVWFRLAEHCGRIREPDRLAAWLATTTRNEALRVVTKKRQRSLSRDVAEQAEPQCALLDELAVDYDTLATC